MCLRFVFLLITRVITWLRLSRREDAQKTAEILTLRHQLAVPQRHQARRPDLNWADRALLATLFGVIPNTRRHGLRLLVTPDTILRWHRDIVRRRWAARSVRGRSGRPATRRNIKALVLRLARENTEWGYRRELLDRTLLWNQDHLRRILREYENHHNQHLPHRSLHAAAPLKPLPKPVDLDQYRVRKQARVGGLINEYRWSHDMDEVFGTHNRPAGRPAAVRAVERRAPRPESWKKPTSRRPSPPTRSGRPLGGWARSRMTRRWPNC